MGETSGGGGGVAALFADVAPLEVDGGRPAKISKVCATGVAGWPAVAPRVDGTDPLFARDAVFTAMRDAAG